MSEKKRLHPITIVITGLKVIKDAFLPLIILFVINFPKAKEESGYFIFIPLILIAFSVITGLVRWLRFSYWVEDQELRIEYGVFVRKKRYIPLERIQSISISEGIFQRLFGLAKVKIETAGSSDLGDAEAELTAITKEDVYWLEQELKRVKEDLAVQDMDRTEKETTNQTIQEKTFSEEPTQTIFTMGFKDLFILALTSGGALGIIGALVAFILQFDEIISLDWIYKEFLFFINQGIILFATVFLIVIVISYLLAIIQTMVKYAYFTVTKNKEELRISRGLLEKSQLSIPIERIQGIIVRENIIRKLFGYATVYIVHAGISANNEGSGSNVMIFPLIRKEEISKAIHSCLPKYQIETNFHPIPRRAKTRYILRPIYVFLIPVCLAAYFLKPWGVMSFALLPLVGYLGYLSYLYSGWNISGEQLALRSRFINAETTYMFKSRIQSLDISTTFFQRRKRLGTVYAILKSGFGLEAGKVRDVSQEDLDVIYHWFSRTKTDSFDYHDITKNNNLTK